VPRGTNLQLGHYCCDRPPFPSPSPRVAGQPEAQPVIVPVAPQLLRLPGMNHC